MFYSISEFGRTLVGAVKEIGRIYMFSGEILVAVPGAIAKRENTLEQMVSIGIGSFPLVFVTAIFTGGVAAVQAAYQFQNFVPMRYLGSAIERSVVIELGPVLTALVVGGRVGASIAAELGTMKVTEQIDAMESLGISPIRYLVAPRFIAATLMLPVATIFADVLAMLGAFAVAHHSLDMRTQTFMEGIRMFFYARDIFGGLIKSFFFGMIIATMGCYHGFRTEGGAEGVGIATTRAVVYSCVLILVTDYFLASALFRTLWG